MWNDHFPNRNGLKLTTLIGYRKVISSRLSRLVVHPRIFRLFMKRNFDAYVLWPLDKMVQNWIVYCSRLYGIPSWELDFWNFEPPYWAQNEQPKREICTKHHLPVHFHFRKTFLMKMTKGQQRLRSLRGILCQRCHFGA
jgi:hypothetical protein